MDTLDKKLAWQPPSLNVNVKKRVRDTSSLRGGDFFCPPVSTLGRRKQLWYPGFEYFVHLLSPNHDLAKLPEID